MATRFQAEFYNIRNEIWNVSIDDADYVGSTVTIDTMEDGFTLSYADEENIIGSKVNINILVDDTTTADIDTFLADLLTAEETRFTVKITWKATPASSAQTYWVGYVLPDLSGYDDQVKYIFTVTATDGLGRLKGIDYLDDSGASDVPFGYRTVQEHILACLNEDVLSGLYWAASSGVFLRTVVNWQDSAVGAPAAAVCPTTRIQINGEVFAKPDGAEDGDGWEFFSCYEVLKQICIHFDARLFFSQGCYRFEQFNERSDDTFYERTFARDGTLIGSSASAGYDKKIDQGAGGFKIATIRFNYRPALKKVVATYDHNTYKNYLAGLAYKWYKNSTNNGPKAISDISVDTDTRLRVSGKVKLNLSVPVYTGPWRYTFAMYVTTSGGHRWRSLTDAVVSNGNPINVITRELDQWQIAGVWYEITTPFIFTQNYNETVTFSALSDVVPSGTTSLEVDFDLLGGETNTNGVQSVTVNDWRVSDLVLLILGNDDAENFETNRRYTLNNPVAGNSEVLSFDTIFGAAIKPWTPTKLLTSTDGSTWTDTTATWEANNAGTSFEFGELLVSEIMSARRTPKKLMQGSVSGLAIHAHSRLVTPDTLGWLMKQATMTAREGVWTGEWFNAGIDRITSGPVIRKKPYEANELIALPQTPGSVSVEGVFSPIVGAGNLALSAITTNYLLDSLPSKNVSSLDLTFPVAANTYLAGDVILLIDPYNFLTDALVVAADASEGDTTLSIVPKVVTHDYTAGSHIVYAPLNKTTSNQGGGGSAGGVRKVDYKEFEAIGGTKTINGKIMSAYFAADSAGLARTISIGTTSGGYEICQDEPINNGSRWTLAYTEFFDSPTFYITCDSAVSMYFGYDTL